MRLSSALFAALFSLCFSSAHGQQPSSEEAAIRHVLSREADGWNTFNATEVISTYSEDVIWQNPFGVRLHSRKEVETFLRDLLARPGYAQAQAPRPLRFWTSA